MRTEDEIKSMSQHLIDKRMWNEKNGNLRRAEILIDRELALAWVLGEDIALD